MFWNISIGVSKHSVSVLCARHSDEHWGLMQTWWGMFLILREEHNLLGKLKPKRNCAVAVQWEMCDCSHNTKAGGNTWGYYAKLNKSGKYHMVSFIYGIKKKRERERRKERALASVAQWVEHWPADQRSPVQFLVRAHAWLAVQDPGWEHNEATNQCLSRTLTFISLSFFLPSPLSKNINKIFCKNFLKRRRRRTQRIDCGCQG